MSYKIEFIEKVKSKYEESLKVSYEIDKIMVEIQDYFTNLKEELKDEAQALEEVEVDIDKINEVCLLKINYIHLQISKDFSHTITVKFKRLNDDVKEIDRIGYKDNKIMSYKYESQFETELLDQYLKDCFEEVLN